MEAFYWNPLDPDVIVERQHDSFVVAVWGCTWSFYVLFALQHDTSMYVHGTGSQISSWEKVVVEFVIDLPCKFSVVESGS